MFATDGRIVAGHPIDLDGEFLVPGKELEAILKRLKDEPKVKLEDGRVVLRAGRFSGSLEVLPPSEWAFDNLDQPTWQKFPEKLVAIFRDLRPFVSENAVHRWSIGIAIDDGWCYASNNVVLAGCKFPEARGLEYLVPIWAVDFILGHSAGLSHWALETNCMMFRWENGAWMRSTLIEGKFPEKAGELIRSVEPGSQRITPDYREAITRIGELSETAITIYADRVEGRTAKAVIREELQSETPPGGSSVWSNTAMVDLVKVASNWSPSKWPQPVSFQGERVQGVIAGMLAHVR